MQCVCVYMCVVGGADGQGQAEAMQVRNSGLGPSLLVCKPSYFTYKVLTLDGQFDLCLPR